MLERLDTTIVAVSSAPGYGRLGIVRLSGPAAIDISDKIVRLTPNRRLADHPGASRLEGEVSISDHLTLPASFYLFRKPRSYTRQDMVEIHTVGSPAALDLVRRRTLRLGAVQAEPGEFTARAFLNGAMDLTGAEAVAAVIRAQTDTQLRAARRMKDGLPTRHLRDTTQELTELLALIEADIDFAEEPIEFITPDDLGRRLEVIRTRLDTWMRGSVALERFDVLPHILLLGPPNAGKSTLMNRLSDTPRAICAAAAGTTRDILSAPIRLGRREAVLLDTAGMEVSDDAIMAQARDLALSSARHVDLICLVVDVGQPVDESLVDTIRSLRRERLIVVANKTDLVARHRTAQRNAEWASRDLGPVCAISAKTGDGIRALQEMIAEALADRKSTTLGDCMLISERQQAAVQRARESLIRVIRLSEQARETLDCADLLAFELRDALDALGAVTGAVTTDDLLARVFADFCIGK